MEQQRKYDVMVVHKNNITNAYFVLSTEQLFELLESFEGVDTIISIQITHKN